jgi:hypothetical protein
MTPQKTAAREIRAHYTLLQRAVLGDLWRAFIRPTYIKGQATRSTPNRRERRAALGRLARLRQPNPQEMARAMLP